MSLRQRLSACYYRVVNFLFGTTGIEYYLFEETKDTNGKIVIKRPVIRGLEYALDWRALHNAERKVLPLALFLYPAVIIFEQYRWEPILSALGYHQGSPMIPGVFLLWVAKLFLLWNAAGFHYGWIILRSFVGLLIACFALLKIMMLYHSFEREHLSAEEGSSGFLEPEYLAPMFPPGYDLYGGFPDNEKSLQQQDVQAMELAALRLVHLKFEAQEAPRFRSLIDTSLPTAKAAKRKNGRTSVDSSASKKALAFFDQALHKP